MMPAPGPCLPGVVGLNDQEAETVRCLVEMTGLPPVRIMYLATRSEYHRDRFCLAQVLACHQWSCWPGEDGKWRRDPAQQQEKLRRCVEDILNPPRVSDHPLGWD